MIDINWKSSGLHQEICHKKPWRQLMSESGWNSTASTKISVFEKTNQKRHLSSGVSSMMHDKLNVDLWAKYGIVFSGLYVGYFSASTVRSKEEKVLYEVRDVLGGGFLIRNRTHRQCTCLPSVKKVSMPSKCRKSFCSKKIFLHSHEWIARPFPSRIISYWLVRGGI